MNAAYLQSLQGLCSCGRTHSMTVLDIVMKNGALFELGTLLAKHGYNRDGWIICDENTWAAAGQTVSQVLNTQNRIILDPNGLHADEKATAYVLEKTQDAAYYIAVGSGTVHDITRYCAHKRGKDFISVPTACSVDGYTSTMAAMTWGGLKITEIARAPKIIVADLDVLAEAPYRLTCAGFGDIIGKYTALADWQMCHHITGEPVCERILGIQQENLRVVSKLGPALKKRDPKAYEALMEALLMSGIAMEMMGNSRPASGVEHHISHLWETHALGNTVDALHGEKVGVGTVLGCRIYKRLLEIDDLTPYVHEYRPITRERIEPYFGKLTDNVMAENKEDILKIVDPQKLVAAFPAVRKVLEELPSAEEITAMLVECGAPSTPAEVGIDDDMLRKTMECSAFARNRLTMNRMLQLMQPELVSRLIR